MVTLVLVLLPVDAVAVQHLVARLGQVDVPGVAGAVGGGIEGDLHGGLLTSLEVLGLPDAEVNAEALGRGVHGKVDAIRGERRAHGLRRARGGHVEQAGVGLLREWRRGGNRGLGGNRGGDGLGRRGGGGLGGRSRGFLGRWRGSLGHGLWGLLLRERLGLGHVLVGRLHGVRNDRVTRGYRDPALDALSLRTRGLGKGEGHVLENWASNRRIFAGAG